MKLKTFCAVRVIVTFLIFPVLAPDFLMRFLSKWTNVVVLLNKGNIFKIKFIKYPVTWANLLRTLDLKWVSILWFFFNTRNYSLEVSNFQLGKSVLNIILSRVIDFDIKEKMACNINFILPPLSKIKVSEY